MTTLTAVAGLGAFAALVVGYVSLMVSDGMPFAMSYHPADLEAWFELAGVYLVAAWLLRTRRWAGMANAGLLVTSALAYAAYHRSHPGAAVTGFFGDPEPVTPFHQQLAVPVFCALIGASVIRLSAVRWTGYGRSKQCVSPVCDGASIPVARSCARH